MAFLDDKDLLALCEVRDTRAVAQELRFKNVKISRVKDDYVTMYPSILMP